MSPYTWSSVFVSVPLSVCVGLCVGVVSAVSWGLPFHEAALVGNAAGVLCWAVLLTLPPSFCR